MFINLGRNLVSLTIIRKALGTTMESIAEFSSIDRQTYSRIENGDAELTNKYILSITKFFKQYVSDYLKNFNQDYYDFVVLSVPEAYSSETFDRKIWFDSYFNLVGPDEREVLLNAASKNIEDINSQVLLYLQLLGYIYKLSEENQLYKRRILKEKNKETDKLNFQITINGALSEYARNIRVFIFKNLEKEDFIPTDYYWYELLFWPRVDKNLVKGFVHVIEKLI